MNEPCQKLTPDELPELSELHVAQLIRLHGLGAFSTCAEVAEHIVSDARAYPLALDVSLLRFEGGVLKLTRGQCRELAPACQFLSIDFHDYREVVMDQRIVEDAYRRFACFAQQYADSQQDCAGISMQCCPEQGTAFVTTENDGMPSEDTLARFLMSYFGAKKVALDLHRAFGEATLEFCRATVPSLVSVLVM